MKTVNFEKPFIDTGYVCVISPNRNGNTISNYWEGDSGGSLQKHLDYTKITIRRDSYSYSANVSVIIIGRWK